MADFSYNQEIAAADLNNIVIDFGTSMTYPFEAGITYAVNKLNDITAALCTAGVLPGENTCALSYNSNTGKINVGSGVIVFSNGAKMRLPTGAGIQLQGTGMNDGVVYAVMDINSLDAALAAAPSVPSGEDISVVVLGYFTYSNGYSVSTNVGRMAHMKLGNAGTPVTVNIEHASVAANAVIYDSGNTDISVYHYVVFLYNGEPAGMYDLVNGKNVFYFPGQDSITDLPGNRNNTNDSVQHYNPHYGAFDLGMVDGKLTITNAANAINNFPGATLLFC